MLAALADVERRLLPLAIRTPDRPRISSRQGRGEQKDAGRPSKVGFCSLYACPALARVVARLDGGEMGGVTRPPPNGGQTLLIVAGIAPACPAEDQGANSQWQRFAVDLTPRTRRALRAANRGAADLSPDPSPHNRIMGSGRGKSPVRGADHSIEGLGTLDHPAGRESLSGGAVSLGRRRFPSPRVPPRFTAPPTDLGRRSAFALLESCAGLL